MWSLIEADLLGGTCPNRGCTPKKVLVAAGHALHEIERVFIHHIAVGKPKLDWAALIDREKDMVKDIPANLARTMAKRNVEVIKGHAVFAGPNTQRFPRTSSTCSVMVRRRIARRYGVRSQPAFPIPSQFYDCRDVAGQIFPGPRQS